MYFPELGPEVPQSGGRGRRWVGRLLLVLCRWHVSGQIPNRSKLIMVLAPHTSLMDFLTAIATMLATGFHCNFLMAAGYFWWPLGSLLRWLGGNPVNQYMRNNLVAQISSTLRDSDKYILGIFPEGKRIKVMDWKTGFLRIANSTGAPMQLVTLDYDKRVTDFGQVMESTGNLVLDMESVQKYFQGAVGKNPEHFDADCYHL
ncbi:1-acyl-sn-glycerol-3-phosphate acyltransferase [Candidatus Neomarinimicrobiota bacterium]